MEFSNCKSLQQPVQQPRPHETDWWLPLFGDGGICHSLARFKRQRALLRIRTLRSTRRTYLESNSHPCMKVQQTGPFTQHFQTTPKKKEAQKATHKAIQTSRAAQTYFGGVELEVSSLSLTNLKILLFLTPGLVRREARVRSRT